MEYYDNRFSPTEANDYDNEIKNASLMILDIMLYIDT